MSNINEQTSSESDAATIVETKAGAAKSSSRKPNVEPAISSRNGASSQIGQQSHKNRKSRLSKSQHKQLGEAMNRYLDQYLQKLTDGDDEQADSNVENEDVSDRESLNHVSSSEDDAKTLLSGKSLLSSKSKRRPKPHSGKASLKNFFPIEDEPYRKPNLPNFAANVRQNQTTMGNYLTVRSITGQQINMQMFGVILESLQSVQMNPIVMRHKLSQKPDNYTTWAKIMMSKFRLLGLSVFLLNDFDEDVRESDQYLAVTEIIRDHLIQNVESETLLNTVLNAETGVDAWKQLETDCMGNSYVRGTAVIHKLHELHDRKLQDVKKVVDEFKTIMIELSKLFNIDEDGEILWINYLLTLLPTNFMFVSSIIRNQKYTRLNEVYTHLLDEYQVFTRNAKSEYVNEISSLKSGAKSKTQGEKHKGKQKNVDSSSEKCTYCGKANHTDEECVKKFLDGHREKKKKKAEKANGQKSSTNAITVNQNNVVQPDTTAVELNQIAVAEMLKNTFIASLNDSSDQIADPKNYNILDGGCTWHSVSTLAGCVALSPVAGLSSNVANGGSEPVVGIGTFLFATPQGTCIRFENVHYSPGLTSNYIAHGLLKRQGYKTIETKEGLEIYKDNKFVFKAKLNELNHFEMEGEWVSNQICSVVRGNRALTINERYMNWHRRLAHTCFEHLEKMKEDLKLKSKPNGKLKCNDCLINKCKRPPFRKRKKGVDRPLRLVHSDVCGQIDIPNLLNVRYFITFIDDYSRHIMLYLMKRKSEAVEYYRQYKAYIEKQTGLEIMSIRTDGGGEYTSNEFTEMLRSEGVAIQRTCASSSQMNGIAERANQTLVYSAKTMIYASGMKVEVWPYALKFAAYIHNRVVTSSTGFKIPLFRLHNCNPDFDEIIEFGAHVVAVNLDSSTKFAPNGLVGRFLGYPDEYDGCYILIEKERKVLVSRDVYVCEPMQRNPPDPDLDDLDYLSNKYPNQVVDVPVDQDEQVYQVPLLRTRSAVSTEQSRQQNRVDQPASRQQPTVQSPSAESVQRASSEPRSQDSDRNHSIDRMQPDPQAEQHPQVNLPDEQNRVVRPVRLATGETFADLPIGAQISLNYEEERRFREFYPDRQLVVQKYIRSTLPGKQRKFIVNAIQVPKSLAEAVEGPDSTIWAQAILEEYNNWQMLNMFKRVERPKGAKVIGLLWVFSTKYAADGTLEKAKARLCALGNQQKFNIDEIDKYAPVVRPITLKTLFAITVQQKLKPFQIDVRAAFLNSRLKRPVYCYPADGFQNPDRPNEVWEVHGAAYGLAESAKAWNDTLNEILVEYGLQPTLSDPCFYQNADQSLLVASHVDDLYGAVDADETYEAFARFVKKKVAITEKDEVKNFLGYELEWQNGRLLVHQKAYITGALERFGFSNAHPVNSPMILGQDLEPGPDDQPLPNRAIYPEMCGTLMYAASGTRVDISYALNRLCRYMANPTVRHLSCLKRVFRYLKGTADRGLIYSKGQPELVGYADADFANDKVDSRSISGTATFLFDNLIDWSSRKQTSVALSTCEAETLSIRNESCTVLYMRGLLEEIGLKSVVAEPTVIFNDNLSASMTLKDGGAFHRNNHYRIRVNFLRDLQRKRLVKVIHVPGTQMVADLLTKALAPTVFSYLLALMNFGGLSSERATPSEPPNSSERMSNSILRTRRTAEQ